MDAKPTINAPAQKPKSRSKMFLIAAVVPIASGVLWLTAHRRTTQGQTPERNTETDSVKSVLHLESFVVNLADPDQTAFLRIGIDLGLSESPSKEKPVEKSSPTIPKVRDIILSILTTSQSGQLIAADGKTKLKEQLLKALQEGVPSVPIKEIYFTEFLVQR